jgi:hypothetical protein
VAWLDTETSFAYVTGKPLVIFADHPVTPCSLLASPDIAILKYRAARPRQHAHASPIEAHD